MNHRISSFRIAASFATILLFTQSHAQVVTAFAGNSSSFGYGGDGGPATASACLMHNPQQLAHDATGNFYFIDHENYVVRKVSTSGTITTIAGNGTPLLSGINPSGVAATSLSLNAMAGIAVDASGNVYFGEEAHISKVTPSGTYYIYAGTGTSGGYSGNGGPATAALMIPTSLAFDPSGNLFMAEYSNNVVRKINTTSGIITVAAGMGPSSAGYTGDGGPATAAMLNGPRDAKFDAAGNMYIIDASNNMIRKVNTTGIISKFAGTGGALGFSGDGGPATAANLNSPESMAVDPASGDVYIADGPNQRIRRISGSTGVIVTWVGTGSWIWNGNGHIGPMTSIWGVQGMDVYSSVLYFSESSNDDIRKISTIPTASLMASALYNKDGQMTLFPSPNNGSFSLVGTAPQGTNSIQICIKDITGKTISAYECAIINGGFQAQVNMPVNTPPGVYVLIATSPAFNSKLSFVKE